MIVKGVIVESVTFNRNVIFVLNMLIVLLVFLCKLSLLDLTFSSMNNMTRQMHISEHFVSFVTSSANAKYVSLVLIL